MPEQHPIPQQISSYSFKLVGDMTLKQFTQLAAGALASLLFYATPLHPFIKWPLIVVSFLFGVALAFLPIEDRPLSTWIVIFFRSIYSPTYFVWRKEKPRKYFMEEQAIAKTPAIAAAQKKEEKEELLQPVIKTTPAVEKLEEKEKTFLTNVTENFIRPGTSVVISATPMHTYSTSPLPPAQVTSTATQTQNKPINKPLTVPETKPVEVEHVVRETAPPQTPFNQQQSQPAPQTISVTPMPKQAFTATKAAEFSPDVMPPFPPTKANIVVGQVVSTEGKIIEGAILEIKDSDGRPVRALKSNKLGHFMIATPLLNGRYEITTEKEGWNFEPVYFDAEDKIIPPMAIWAKHPTNENTEGLSQKSGTIY